MDRALIERFAAGGPLLEQAVAGLSPEDIVARPGPGEWSILELVVHLVDSDLLAIERMKRIVAEDNPRLMVADENAWIACLAPHAQSLEDAVTLFTVGRRQFARILRALPDEAFSRIGTHSIKGPQTLQGVLVGFIDHLESHLKYLLAKRARLGKPAA